MISYVVDIAESIILGSFDNPWINERGKARPNPLRCIKKYVNPYITNAFDFFEESADLRRGRRCPLKEIVKVIIWTELDLVG